MASPRVRKQRKRPTAWRRAIATMAIIQCELKINVYCHKILNFLNCLIWQLFYLPLKTRFLLLKYTLKYCLKGWWDIKFLNLWMSKNVFILPFHLNVNLTGYKIWHNSLLEFWNYFFSFSPFCVYCFKCQPEYHSFLENLFYSSGSFRNFSLSLEI